MKNVYNLIFLFFLFGRLICHSGVWTQEHYPYEGLTTETAYKKEVDRFQYSGKLKVAARNSYPFFLNNSYFFQEVNNLLCATAKTMLHKFTLSCMEEELYVDLDDEAISFDLDKREFSYSLTPTHASQNLISVFGELHSYAGMPHGSSRYYSFNFSFDQELMVALTLKDLFLAESDFLGFLKEYCLNTLKTERIGYFNKNLSDYVPIEIKAEDLEIFTISKNGLTITFQPYRVGGWADGPYSITIPFELLRHLMRPNGPLNEFE